MWIPFARVGTPKAVYELELYRRAFSRTRGRGEILGSPFRAAATTHRIRAKARRLQRHAAPPRTRHGHAMLHTLYG